jgi:phosphopantetheinyl transferase
MFFHLSPQSYKKCSSLVILNPGDHRNLVFLNRKLYDRMSELFRKIIAPGTQYAVWHITESIEELCSAIRLSESEDVLYRTFVAESRKKQWLAYRLLIRALLDPDTYPVEYDPSGKPYLAGSTFHISVTHTEDLAAVIISSREKVGIDIERIRSRIENVKEKFLSPAELAQLNSGKELEQITLAWCAKEALYKFYGCRNLDFRENIRLQIPQTAGVPFWAEIRKDDACGTYLLNSEKLGEFILVYLSGL